MKRPMTAAIAAALLLSFLLLPAGRSALFAAGNARHFDAADFYAGNALYEKGDFSGAAREYQAIVDAGHESGNLYYNLGNAYFKAGELGKAILYYERAKEVMPQDADLKSNLEHALSFVEDGGNGARAPWWVMVLENATSFYGISQVAVILSAVYTAIVAIVIALIFFGLGVLRRTLSAILMIALLLFAVGAASFGLRLYEKKALKSAIVVSKEEDGRFEPLEKSTVYFKVRSGARVFVTAERAGWYKIRRPDGKSAWIKRSAVEVI